VQSPAGDGLTQVARWVSEAGTSRAYLAALVVVGFAGHMSVGLVLTQGLLWNLVLAGCLKQFVALPRPVDFHPPVTGMRGLGLPTADAIADARTRVTTGYGFPSGHAGNATVLWGGAAIHARSRPVWAFAAAIVLAMSASRVYLGQHFVGDVIGGVLTGGMVLALLAAVFLRHGQPVWSAEGNRWLITLAAGSALLPPLILALQLGSNPTTLGRLSGFDSALLLLMRLGLPSDAGGPIQRASRVLLAFGLYASVDYLVTRVLLLANVPPDWCEYAAAATATFALLIGTCRLGAILGLYARTAAPARITAPTASPG
jgi:membrane-associated phospholipid phosphatase